jgi:uncharacterized protein (TIGR00725 family)
MKNIINDFIKTIRWNVVLFLSLLVNVSMLISNELTLHSFIFFNTGILIMIIVVYFIEKIKLERYNERKKRREELKSKTCSFFGGAINDTTTKEYNDTILIGKLLSEYNINVKNGGYRGLMEAVSKGASTKGNVSITGYTCKTYPSTKGNDYLTETIVCDNVYNRLENLIEDSSIFIVQKGGIGTLSELFLLLDEVRKKKDKPTIYLIGDMYPTLIRNVSYLMDKNLYPCMIFCEDYNDFEVKFKQKMIPL